MQGLGVPQDFAKAEDMFQIGAVDRAYMHRMIRSGVHLRRSWLRWIKTIPMCSFAKRLT